MRKLLIPALAAVIACPAFAYDVDAEYLGLQPYVAIRGGITNMNLQYKIQGDKQTVSDTVFQGRGALGMSFYRGGRTEVEYTFYTKGDKKKDFAIGEIDVGMKMQDLQLNTYLDLGQYNYVQPFIGVGAGVAFTKITRDASALGGTISFDDKSDTNFTAMGAVGISIALEHFAIDLAARYNYVDVASGMHNIGGDVGIRISF